MNESERLRICQEWAARLACAIYNGEDWDKQAVASYFHMGEEGLSYWFPGDPPERLTEGRLHCSHETHFRTGRPITPLV